MSNVDVVRRFYDEVCNGRHLDLMGQVVTAGHRYHDPNSPPAFGPEEMASVIRTYQDGVEGHWGIEDIFENGDRVTVRWIGSGTHSGEVNGIPPTGKKVRVDAISIHRLESGKIAETWTVWDTLTFLKQIGVIPEAAPAGEASITGTAAARV